jgi:hypothetical protein
MITKETLIARHKLLLREGLKVIVGDLVDTLKSTGGRERPARSALALVLHGGDGTLGLPIDGSGDRRHILGSLMDVVSNSILLSLGQTKASLLKELVPRQVRVLVVGHGEGRLLGVVLGDEVMVISKVLKLVEEISAGLGLHLVFLHPIEELLFVEGTVMDIGRGNSQGRDG